MPVVIRLWGSKDYYPFRNVRISPVIFIYELDVNNFARRVFHSRRVERGNRAYIRAKVLCITEARTCEA